MNELNKMFIIIGLLIAGVFGLAMSLCGGAVTFSFILGASGPAQFIQMIPQLLLPIGSVVVGILTLRKAYIKIKTTWLDESTEE